MRVGIRCRRGLGVGYEKYKGILNYRDTLNTDSDGGGDQMQTGVGGGV